MNWLGILAFAFHGTLILVNGKQVSFTNALAVPIVSDVAGSAGYPFYGWLGDLISRRNTIALGYVLRPEEVAD